MKLDASMRTATAALALGAILAAGAAAAGQTTAPDGALIHYESAGEGSPALVFVHGWCCDETYWRDQMRAFAPKHQVVAIDLAGHGQSGPRADQYTMEAFGQDVAAVLKQLDIGDAVLIGHSMGGAVVVEAALAAPERVRGLIGIDNFQQLTFTLPPEQLEAFTGAMRQDFRGTVEPFVRRMFPAGADSALVADIAQDMASAPVEVGVGAMRHLLQWYSQDAPRRLPLLKAPLMCINSDLESTDEAALRAAVPGYQVRYMKGRGHFLMREDPQTFNALLAETVAQFAR